ncbi:leukocyte immunoglobulin-like receptor subfamily B member 3A [Microtus pennsylvanicus]|uniref:leukocyte immunoglobulin-like receptor subfamily B member 3A n=1 Tax=Microtus pennsylvanicus TaxID=10058 RepID=UPI003F6B55AF
MPGTLTAFLCLGLTLSLRTPIHTGSLPNPVLRAEPGSVVANGSQVTIICEGTPDARDYYLYQIGNQGSLQRLTPMKPGNIAKFLIPIIQWSHAGRYLCFYHKPPRRSKKSNTLELVVTGYLLPKPLLSSLTSVVVTSGEIMTFQCASWERYNGFVLTKEDEKFSRLQDSQYINSTKQFQALFHTGPVTISHTGIFRCYGYKNSTYMWSNPSDSLEIHIAGQFRDTPTLSVLPGSRMSSGEDVTLVCQSSHRRSGFVLSKEGTAHSLLYLRSVLQDKLYQAKFFMRNVTFTHGGTYKCYSSEDLLPHMLSYPSNAVELVVSGSSEDPDFLSEEPIPTFGLERCLKVLFGIAVAFLLLLLFLSLLLLRCKLQEKRRKMARRETTSVQLLAEAVEPVTMDRGPQKSSISAAAIHEKKKKPV